MFIKTSIHNHRPYMVPFPVVRNVNKHNDAVLNHKFNWNKYYTKV